MSTERPKTYYTAVFLRGSFRAIKESMAGKAEDGLPCWLDTRMLGMLCRDLKACWNETDDQDPAHRPLADAREACDRLLARCPGGLDSTLCHHHLDAILEALNQAIAALDRTPSPPDASRWQSATRYLLQGLKRLS